jgi:hypothetical protein
MRLTQEVAALHLALAGLLDDLHDLSPVLAPAVSLGKVLQPAIDELGSPLGEAVNPAPRSERGLSKARMASLSGPGRTALKRRRWRPEQKALIVLEGLQARPSGKFSRAEYNGRLRATS